LTISKDSFRCRPFIPRGTDGTWAFGLPRFRWPLGALNVALILATFMTERITSSM
jgi:hypothetical protein